MPKKGSSKPSTPMSGDPVADREKKSSSTPRNPGNEIDKIFSGKKRKKPEQKKAEQPADGIARKPDKVNKSKKKKKKSEARKDTGFVDPLRSRKRVNGITIYSEGELGIDREDAGGTCDEVKKLDNFSVKRQGF